MSSSETPIAVPTMNAATMPRTPMLIPVVVATKKTATSTSIEINSLDMCPCSSPSVDSDGQRRAHQLHGMAGLPTRPVADLLAA